MVVIVLGLPGSGKSYFASRLASLMNADYINSDQVRSELTPGKTYSEKEKSLVYDSMMTQMTEILKKGKRVVLDATFYKEDIRKQFVKAAEAYGEIFFIEVVADEKIIRERLEKVRKDSDADFDVHKKIKQQWEPLDHAHLILQSTADNIDEMLSKAAEYLQLTNDYSANP